MVAYIRAQGTFPFITVTPSIDASSTASFKEGFLGMARTAYLCFDTSAIEIVNNSYMNRSGRLIEL